MRRAIVIALLLTGCRTQAEPPVVVAEPPARGFSADVSDNAEFARAFDDNRVPDYSGVRIVEGAPAMVEAASAVAAPAEKPSVVFEKSEPWPKPGPGTLGSMSYPPTEKEKPFFDRVFGESMLAGAVMEMPRESGKDVAWFGVVRGIAVDTNRGETRLLLENKYFDGITDTHILCVSLAGGGDFVATLPGTKFDVQPLALVRVYGRVASVKDDIPRVDAAYVRHFGQGTYCFMFVNGTPAGNQEWRKLCTVPDDQVYSPFPRPAYYERILGRREDFAPGKVPVPKD